MNWAIVFSILMALFLIVATIIAIVVTIFKWKKAAAGLKFAMGCISLTCFSGSVFFSILFLIFLLSYSSDKAAPERTLASSRIVGNFLQKNSSENHDMGANIFAEAVAENDREKLFESIGYLEKACAGDPDNNAKTVDLADAYMEVNSPSLTAMAIELYESVFDGFDNDPLLARIIAGYQQLGNYDAAFALAQKRMETCPKEMRRPAAVQLSFIAISSGKTKEGEAAILADIERRGNDPLLQLTIATLQQASGNKTGAVASVEQVLADKKLDPPIQQYAIKLKEKIAHE